MQIDSELTIIEQNVDEFINRAVQKLWNKETGNLDTLIQSLKNIINVSLNEIEEMLYDPDISDAYDLKIHQKIIEICEIKIVYYKNNPLAINAIEF